jgi:hypothetical protein
MAKRSPDFLKAAPELSALLMVCMILSASAGVKTLLIVVNPFVRNASLYIVKIEYSLGG